MFGLKLSCFLPACANSTGSGWPWKDLPVDQWAVQPRDTGECTAGAEQEARVRAWPRPNAVALVWHHRSTPSGASGCSISMVQGLCPSGGSGEELVGSLTAITWEYYLCWIVWQGSRWRFECTPVAPCQIASDPALPLSGQHGGCHVTWKLLGESRLLSAVTALPCQASALVWLSDIFSFNFPLC